MSRSLLVPEALDVILFRLFIAAQILSGKSADPHRDPHAKTTGKGRRGYSSPPVLSLSRNPVYSLCVGRVSAIKCAEQDANEWRKLLPPQPYGQFLEVHGGKFKLHPVGNRCRRWHIT